MKQTIYIDVLISVNLFINYFLLMSVVKILNLKPERKKLVLSAFIGSLYSLFILLPPINNVLSLIVKLIMSATIVLLAFGIVPLKVFFKIIGAFYGVNFIFGGIVFFVWHFISPNGIFINNNIVYLNLSPIFLIITTFIAYVAIRVMDKFTATHSISKLNCDILIQCNDKSTVISAKIDTGNTLREPFSNIPVIVAQYQCIESIIPQALKIYLCSGALNNTMSNSYYECKFNSFRMIPFKAVSGEGLLPAFKPDYIKILSDSSNLKKEAYIAICDDKVFNNEYVALVNPDLIE